MKNAHRITTIAFSLALFASVGCTRYTMRGVRAEALPSGSSVGLAVISHEGGGLFSRGPSRPVLEDYMIAALVGRGFKPRTMRLDMLASEPLLRRLLAQGVYSNVSDLRIDINKNGVATEQDEKATTEAIASGNAEEIAGPEGSTVAIVKDPEYDKDEAEFKVTRIDVEPRNEMTDAVVRYEAMLELADLIHQKWNVEYMVFVNQFDDYSFAAHAVRLSDKTIVNSLVFSGNQKGLRRALGKPVAGSWFDEEQDPGAHLDVMRFAEFFAAKL